MDRLAVNHECRVPVALLPLLVINSFDELFKYDQNFLEDIDPYIIIMFHGAIFSACVVVKHMFIFLSCRKSLSEDH